jgi:hypothetical protein
LESQIGGEFRRPRNEERLNLLGTESGEPCFIFFQQAPAPSGPAIGDHGHARTAERVHIPKDGALGHLKLAGEIASCQA